jgi:hypothetical protein
MIILRGNEKTEAGEMPSEKMFRDMTKFNEELVDAGVMVSGDGLQPASKGVTVTFENDKTTVTEGASPGVIAGFWIWKVGSMQEAIDWVKRIPNSDHEMNGKIDIRPVYEAEDLRTVMPPDVIEQEEQLRQKIADQNAKAASGK